MIDDVSDLVKAAEDDIKQSQELHASIGLVVAMRAQAEATLALVKLLDSIIMADYLRVVNFQT